MPSFDIDFKNIRTLEKSQNYAFEEFCCHLARNYEDQNTESRFFRLRGADGGIECGWNLPDGSQVGWQVKYIFELDKQQLQTSVVSAIKNYKNLKQYNICIPFNLSKKENERFPNYKKEWESEARKQNVEMDINLWDKNKLLDELLKIENYEFRIKFWFDENILSKEWFQNHLEDAISIAGPRYVPELNTVVPINQVYQAFGRTKVWHSFLKETYQGIKELKNKWNECMKTQNSILPEFPKQILPEGKKLHDTLSKIEILIRDLANEKIQGETLANLNLVNIGLKLVKVCTQKLKNEIEKEYGEGVADAASFRQHQREFRASFPTAHYDLSKKIYQKLKGISENFQNFEISIASTLLISGTAGSGKTHSICDFSRNRLKMNLYSVVLFGAEFINQELWRQIGSLLGFSSTLSRDEMLATFNLFGEINNSVVIFFVDALNETENRQFWRTNLPKMITQLDRYTQIKLCISCRTEFLPNTLPTNLKLKNFEHQGFTGVEYESVFNFFSFYKIKSPTIPLISPEFSNPLFLKIICESLANNGHKSIPTSYFGISQIIEEYIKSQEIKISEKLDYNFQDEYVSTAIFKVIEFMKKKNSRGLAWNDAKKICVEEWGDLQNRNSLFDQLLKEGILKETKRTINEKLESYVEFGYEKIFDYLLASSYLKDLDEPAHIFQENGRLSFIFVDGKISEEHIGVIEALAILIPEKFGIEILELLPLVPQSLVWKYFASSFSWRHPNSINKTSIKYFKEALMSPAGFVQAREMLVLLATRENHLLNSEWLHNYLLSFKMIERDSWWSTYLHEQYNNKNSSVYRLINWCFKPNLGNIERNVVRLWSIFLFWCTTASDRRIRDEATKGATNLLKNNMDVWPSILIMFESVDDCYLHERLLASLYGTIMLTDIEREFAVKIYSWLDNYVREYGMPINVKLRDSIRLIVLILGKKGVFDDSILISQFFPPYKSDWPLIIPSDDIIKKYAMEEYLHKFPKLYQSCFDDDFKKYVIDPLVREFEGINTYDAAKWIFKWVIDLGYGLRGHSIFDGYIVGKFGFGRKSETWAERIGKKYQWLAIFELCARLSDNLKLSENLLYNGLETTLLENGFYGRVFFPDFDPTILVRNSKSEKESSAWWALSSYDYSLTESKTELDWIKIKDFPFVKENLLVNSKLNYKFYVLRLEQNWSTKSFDSKNYRVVDYLLHSYIVRKEDFTKAWKGFKKMIQNEKFENPPNTHDFFFGEYSWIIKSQIFKHKLEEEQEFSKPSFPFFHPYLRLINEGENDEFIKNFIDLFAPNNIFHSHSDLFWDGKGKYSDKEGKLIFSNPHYYEEGPPALLVRKEYLDDFLTEKGLRLIWVVYGKKQSVDAQNLQHIPMAFKLDNKKIITGKFQKPNSRFY